MRLSADHCFCATGFGADLHDESQACRPPRSRDTCLLPNCIWTQPKSPALLAGSMLGILAFRNIHELMFRRIILIWPELPVSRGGVSPLRPGSSDINLFCYCERIEARIFGRTVHW